MQLDRDLLQNCAWLPLRISLRDLGSIALFAGICSLSLFSEEIAEAIRRVVDGIGGQG